MALTETDKVAWRTALLSDLRILNNTQLAVARSIGDLVDEVKYLRKEVECLRITVRNK